MLKKEKDLAILDVFRKLTPTIPQLFYTTVGNAGDFPANTYKTKQGWKTINYRQWADISESIAYALMKLGAKKGDDICLLSRLTAPRAWADIAIQISGGISTTVPITVSDIDLVYIINRADIKFIFAENQAVLKRVVQLRDKMPSLQAVICLQEDFAGDQKFTFGLEEFIQQGIDYSREKPDLLHQRWQNITTDDPARVIYTLSTMNKLKCSILKQSEWIEGERQELNSLLEKNLEGKPNNIYATIIPLPDSRERTYAFLSMVAIGALIKFGAGPPRIQNTKDLRRMAAQKDIVIA